MDGWIKLHRSLLDWQWSNDPHVWLVFTHLLLKANHENKEWKGNTIPRGSCITSISMLSKEIGISIKSVRNALDKLKSTNEVASKGTNKYTHISIINYEEYQQKGEQEGKQRANKGQTKGKHLYIKEYKEHKNINNINILLSPQEKEKEKPNLPKKETPLQALVLYLEQVTGAKVVNFGKQAKAWKMMVDAGYTDQQMRYAIEDMAEESFWREHGFDLMTVANQIPKIKTKYLQKGK